MRRKIIIALVILIIVIIVVKRWMKFKEEFLANQTQLNQEVINSGGTNAQLDSSSPSFTDFISGGTTTGSGSGGGGGLLGGIGGTQQAQDIETQKQMILANLQIQHGITLNNEQYDYLFAQSLSTLETYASMSKEQINNAWYSYWGYILIP